MKKKHNFSNKIYNSNVWVIIPAAGSGKRIGKNKNKLLLEVNGKPIIWYTLKIFQESNRINGIVLVVNEKELNLLTNLIKKWDFSKVKNIVIGGKERQNSVYNGLLSLKEINPEIILIHDGARPLINEEIINLSIDFVKKYKAVIVAVPVKDTIKQSKIYNNNIIVDKTIPRDNLWLIQTPQTFDYNLLLDAFERLKDYSVTDESMLLEKLGVKVYIIMGDYKNIKITTPEDIELFKFYLDDFSRV